MLVTVMVAVVMTATMTTGLDDGSSIDVPSSPSLILQSNPILLMFLLLLLLLLFLGCPSLLSNPSPNLHPPTCLRL